jgi:hypothetical protein
MKRIITLSFFFLSISGLLRAQYVSYETQSKWQLGFNVGGTWSTTDVKYKTSAGWGLTLGRSFNYDYGRRLSFDLRGRYLQGYWYGQDYSTTDSTGFTGIAAKPYMDSLGFSVNNFQAQVHRLSLELVLHANGLRERTRWDPYVFGGIGLTWHQTFGDLYANDTLGGIYNYDANDVSKPALSALMDQVYETALDGSNKNTFRVNVMPSLGFGIGYQVAPNVTIGLEHKSTFTGLDDFDGVVKASKYRQDIYHYTSGFINFRFKAHHREDSPTSTTSSSEVTPTPPCIPPSINFIQPSGAGQTVNAINYTVIASIPNAGGRQNIVYKVNGVNNLNYTYNPQNNRFESNVILNEGLNTFEITVSNACGTEAKTIDVSYQKCTLPVIQTIVPSSESMTVSNANFTFSANVQQVANQQGVAVTMNSRSFTTFGFNSTNGNLSGTVVLTPGINTFVITATNSCGSVTKKFEVNYQQCKAPSISMIVPSGTQPTVSQAQYSVSAKLENVTSAQEIKFTQNNQVVPGFTFNAATSVLSANVTLNPGSNAFVITVTNDCGTDVESFNVIYQNCIPPVISMLNPTTSGTTVASPAFTLSATISNTTNQGISITQNNRSITNFGYNAANGTLQSSLTLLPGLNTFVITATNNCGNDSETITVNYQNCVAPVIALISPASSGLSVTSAAYTFKATATNITSAQEVSLKLNGTTVSNVSFNASNGMVSANVNLAAGANTFVIAGTNSCGTDAETVLINYTSCIPPVITVSAPTNGSTVSSGSIDLTATIQNAAGQSPTITINTRSYNISGYNPSTGSLQMNVPLVPGQNTIVISVTNACGSDTETITVNYDNCKPPVLSISSPANSGLTVTQAAYTLSGNASNISNGQQLQITQNGAALSNVVVNNGAFSTNVNLTPGLNTFVLKANNSCGTDSKTVLVTYDNCVPPVINVVSPINGATVSKSTVELNLQIQNAAGQQPTVTINNRSYNVTGYNPTTGLLVMNLPLSQGANTIVISVSNACGTDTETIIVNYQLDDQKIKICYKEQGATSAKTIEIPASAWPSYQALGAVLGECTQINNTGGGSTGTGTLNSGGGIGRPSGTGTTNTEGTSNGSSVGTGAGRPGTGSTSTGTNGNGTNTNSGTGGTKSPGKSGAGKTAEPTPENVEPKNPSIEENKKEEEKQEDPPKKEGEGGK